MVIKETMTGTTGIQNEKEIIGYFGSRGITGIELSIRKEDNALIVMPTINAKI